MRTLSSRLFQVLCGVGLIVFFLSPETAFTAGDEMEFPQASQPGWIRQRVGLTDVEIDYSPAAEKSIELLKAAKVLDESAIRNSQMLIDSLGAK